MPELIQDGPDIPVELMNRRDDGNVVFFCGSGISAPTGLPMFSGLVSEIYDRTSETPTDLEKTLCGNGQYDKVLGLLEDRLNPGRLRREAIEILSTEPPENSLVTHEALLSLSRSDDHGIRLVTTNFDNRFELASSNLTIDSAPRLPLPKPHGWGSLVHLHGRIKADDPKSQDLVMTAADFGRAYLTERWASRFITELFREFTIVFVGYSLNDPVMSYMVDALAAERSRGARFQEAYAFADFRDGASGRKQAELSWQGKNVRPILFSAEDGFGKLSDTLTKWADIGRDPIKSRRQIVFDELGKLPANADDPIAKRVTWALADKPTSKALAEAPAITDEDAYPILAGWLNVFDEAGLMSRPGDTPANGTAHRTPIVGHAFTQHATNHLDDISTRLVVWLAKHLHVPQVLGWAARKGGYLHPDFRDEVRRRLSVKDRNENGVPEIPERLRLFWTILIQNSPVDHGEDLWWADLVRNAASDTERAIVGRAFIESLRPHPAVIPGPSENVQFRNLFEDTSAPITALEECAHFKMLAGDGKLYRRLEQLPFREDLLAGNAFVLSEHLLVSDKLLVDNDSGLRLPQFYRPAIESHDQNRERNDWTFLIDLARDAYFALATQNATYADLLIRMWVGSDIPLLHRLALHVLAEDPKADIQTATKLLLAGDPPCVWSDELYHEVMVFLRKAGHRLPADDLGKLVETIKAGPPSRDTEDENGQLRAREIRIRLGKLASSGAALDAEAKIIADAYQPPPDEPSDRDEFLAWSGSVQWIGPHDHVRPDWQNSPPLDELINHVRHDKITEDEFEGICRIWPSRAFFTLRKLADDDNWPAVYWRRLLWSTNALHREKKFHPSRLRYLSTLLLTAPEDFHVEISSAVSLFVKDLSEALPVEDEVSVRNLWNKAWSSIVDRCDVGRDDALTQALNSAPGRLADAAYDRLWKYQPEAGRGLPEPVSDYFDSIAKSTAGRLGRVMLAAKLYSLFAIAPDWTTQSLLPCMRWGTSNEARDLWTAYAWAARAGPNLLAAIKADFATALGKYAELGEQRSRLIYLFLAASLDEHTIFMPDEIRAVMANLPEDGLVDVAHFFEKRLGANVTEQAENWSTVCFPWLQVYWPKAKERNTTKTSIALVQCLINTGDAFPDALRWAEEYLRPGTDYVLWRVRRSGIHQRWPTETLKLLTLIIPENDIEHSHNHSLQEILNEMQKIDEGIAQDSRFIRLSRL
ncbi:SIR2 family protein [Fodinicurvata sp. EGI_FJ10296]|uniref:SIR2 family protein n=1 Tax=Fodinicurvata sp. EGI_FJ10296 TaxID=3231908 RepID=UPI003452A514